MSKIPMDFSKFKKVKADAHTSTLEHPDGHSITIAHSKLSHKMKGQLEKMPIHGAKNFAEGGEVDPSEDLLTTKAKYYQAQDPNLSFGNATAKAAVEMQQAKDRAASEDAAPAAEARQQQSNYDQSMASLPQTAAQEATTGQTAPVSGVQVASTDPNAGLEQLNRSPSSFDETLQGPVKTPQPAPQGPSDFAAAQQTELGGLTKIGAGQAAEAAALGKKGKQEAGLETKYQTDQQNALNSFNEANAPLVKARQDLMNDIQQGHIDPQHYVNSMDTGGKISSAIGLIIGGMGAGLTHGPNLAAQYLNNQIDRDIDAQKQELGKKENLLSHNLAQSHNLAEAYNMTRMQTNDLLSSHLRQIAGTMADPIAQGRLLQQAGALDQQTGKLQMDIAINKMRMGGAGGADPAKQVPILVPKEHQAQAFKEIEAAENTHKMSDSILKSFDDAAKENTVLRTGAGMLRTPGSVYALHQSMQPTFKDLEGTVRQAAMDNTFKNITPVPGDTDAKVAVKRQALQDYLQSKLSAPTARGYGIDLSKYERTQSVAGNKPPVGQVRFTKAQ